MNTIALMRNLYVIHYYYQDQYDTLLQKSNLPVKLVALNDLHALCVSRLQIAT